MGHGAKPSTKEPGESATIIHSDTQRKRGARRVHAAMLGVYCGMLLRSFFIELIGCGLWARVCHQAPCCVCVCVCVLWSREYGGCAVLSGVANEQWVQRVTSSCSQHSLSLWEGKRMNFVATRRTFLQRVAVGHRFGSKLTHDIEASGFTTSSPRVAHVYRSSSTAVASVARARRENLAKSKKKKIPPSFRLDS